MSPLPSSELSLSWEEFAALKRADREELAKLPPGEAQALVDAVLHPELWKVSDPAQLVWPGDLADADDDV